MSKTADRWMALNINKFINYFKWRFAYWFSRPEWLQMIPNLLHFLLEDAQVGILLIILFRSGLYFAFILIINDLHSIKFASLKEIKLVKNSKVANKIDLAKMKTKAEAGQYKNFGCFRRDVTTFINDLMTKSLVSWHVLNATTTHFYTRTHRLLFHVMNLIWLFGRNHQVTTIGRQKLWISMGKWSMFAFLETIQYIMYWLRTAICIVVLIQIVQRSVWRRDIPRHWM